MSNTYPYYSNNFPDEIDDFDKFQDPNISSIPLINEYYAEIETGTEASLARAKTILDNNPSLKPMIINADRLNKLRDGLLSVEEFYLSDVQQYLINLVKYRGTYSSSVIYNKFNIVKYNGQSYMYINNTASKGHAPTNTTYWVVLTLQGEQGASGVGLSFQGSYNNNTSYPTNIAVEYNGSLYGSLQATQGHPPTIGGSNQYWSLVLNSDTFIVEYNSNSGADIKTAYEQGKTVVVKYTITGGDYYSTDVVYGYLTNVQYTDTNLFYRFMGTHRVRGTANPDSGTLQTYWFSLNYNISASTNTWSMSTFPTNNIYFVEYGTTSPNMIDAHNAGKLVVAQNGASVAYLASYSATEYVFVEIDASRTSHESSIFNNISTWTATLNTNNNTLSWSTAILFLADSYRAIYNSTTPSAFTALELAYDRGLLIYCYYNDKVYYLSSKTVTSNAIQYEFINTRWSNQTASCYIVRCTRNINSGNIAWRAT